MSGYGGPSGYGPTPAGPPPGYGQQPYGPPGYAPPGYGPPGYGPPPAPGEVPWGGPGHQWGPPREPPEPPSSVRSAVALMWGGAFLTLISMPLAFLLEDEIRETLAEQQPALTSSELDLAVSFGQVAAIVGGIIGITLWTINAIFCVKGHSWSRILGTVLFGISLLGLPFNLSQPAPFISRAFQVMSLLVSVGAVVFLWLPDSNRFFTAHQRARRGY